MKVYCATDTDILDKITNKDLWVHVNWYGAPAWIKIYKSSYVYVIPDTSLNTLQHADTDWKYKAIDAYVNNTAQAFDIPLSKGVIEVLYPVDVMTTEELFLLED